MKKTLKLTLFVLVFAILISPITATFAESLRGEEIVEPMA